VKTIFPEVPPSSIARKPSSARSIGSSKPISGVISAYDIPCAHLAAAETTAWRHELARLPGVPSF